MVRSERLREYDGLFIESYVGPKAGWNRLFQMFDSELRILQITDDAAKRTCYRRAHPSFTLYRGLLRMDLQNELALQCFGCLEYRDTSTMGVYGYRVSAGKTEFVRFVSKTPYYNTTTRDFEAGPE